MTHQLRHAPVATTGMLIRKPVAQVFEAFIDPEVTTRFWFTRSSGRLETGKQVRWQWEMYGVSADVTVKALEPCRRIVIEWPDEGGPTTVEWTFTAHGDTATFVEIVNFDFGGDGDAIVRQAVNSAQGFSFVLAGLKALL